MQEFRITLVGDGRSDRALMPIIKWLVDDLYPQQPSTVEFADLSILPAPPPKEDIAQQIAYAKDYYPCDLVVYHRDAETNNLGVINERKAEVMEAIDEDEQRTVVCLVPVRMMETWLLIDEEAIKFAAGNRKYKGKLALPALGRLESNSTPKDTLYGLLKEASGYRGRRLARFNVHAAVHAVADYIDDFSLLRQLVAFETFETDFRARTSVLLNAS